MPDFSKIVVHTVVGTQLILAPAAGGRDVVHVERGDQGQAVVHPLAADFLMSKLQNPGSWAAAANGTRMRDIAVLGAPTSSTSSLSATLAPAHVIPSS